MLPMAAAATSRFYSKKTDHRSKPEVDYLLSFFPNSQTHSADIRNAIASVISVSYMALQGVPVTQWLGEILPASLKAGETKKFWEAVDKENRAEIIKVPFLSFFFLLTSSSSSCSPLGMGRPHQSLRREAQLHDTNPAQGSEGLLRDHDER